jgi:excisionase family DNA binding protein
MTAERELWPINYSTMEGLVRGPNDDPLLTPGEVAAILHVDPKTVSRWAASGRLPFVRTPGGHRRYRRSTVEAFLAEYTRKPERHHR